ncbi:asparagine synthase (glutamine-hydrolyzing) [bacterium]|jgi:asparagine synthase (glutamine-hydrolysing)|nr:asparagine synthase (glutamine-hydrolyzing) [bacterium]
MCGIYGINKILDEEIILSKLKLMESRGPDKTNISFPNRMVSLGHVRLSIVDLDSRSSQPLTIGNYCIVFNGEIYNYKKLRRNLIHCGVKFVTESDTEVLLQAYIKWGDKVLDIINGMFSFVIYDGELNIFFGARDRLGQKPFYYYLDDDKFEFSSSLTSLKYGNEFNVSSDSRVLYLRYGHVPDPYCIYEKVYKLKAGHSFKYFLDRNDLEINKYWDLKGMDFNDETEDFQSVKKRLKNILIDSVKIRMNSDVSMGSFLSGGIDSSLITAIASNISVERLRTFSIKFSEKAFDESVYAEEIAKLLGTDHTTIECSENEILEQIPVFIENFDEPFNDSSGLAQCLLSKCAKKHITVALSGDGADELFLGYQRYLNIKKVSFLYKFSLIKLVFRVIFGFIPSYKARKIASGLRFKTLEDTYQYSTRLFSDDEIITKNRVLPNNFISYLKNKPRTVLESLSDFDIKTYLNFDINTKVDRSTMAYSLEARSPFMDYRVVDFSQKVPLRYKLRNGSGKFIVKEILADYLPRSLFERKKQGFTVPLSHWFKNELKPLVLSLKDPDLYKIIPEIDPNLVSKLIQNHFKGKENNTAKIWSLLCYKLWAEKHFLN